ncbi:chloride channel protein [Nitratifractor sp.]|uniref:chloride channel protein n=1 Tax=Nitratifractor sp. TaxID=2268144 RepID=UPI0025FAF204|nr:chloride channel protein [Nitratifractor sp.]
MLSVTKWLILSSGVGIIIGAIVTLFLNILAYGESARSLLPFHYYYLLPLGLLLSVWLTRRFAPDAEGHGTEKVIEAVHKRHGKIDVAVIPVKLLTTVVTLVTGGSAGKEGPGAQIGAGTASAISDLLRFSKRDRKKLVICGISAGFATVFGTPIAGAIFGIEVLVVGAVMYEVLLPSFVAGFSAFFTAQYLGAHYTYYDISYFQHYFIDLVLILKVILGGVFFGLVAWLIIATLKQTETAVEKIPMNPYFKAIGAGILLILLVPLVGEHYFGLGLDTISQTMKVDSGLQSGSLPWYAFLVKIFYTAVTLGSGGSGGIITPIFYIGATSGHWFGGLFGSEHQLALFAALGFVSVLAGATNAPIAATVMAMELFGMDIAHYAAVSIVISFLVSGHRSVFPSQKIQMSKSDLLEIEFGEDIEHSRVKFDKAQYKRFNKIYHDIQLKRLRHRQDRLKRRKKSEEEEENEGEGVKSEED